MPRTTYTVLVTIAHEKGGALSPLSLTSRIERGLEEGVRDMPGVMSAVASAVPGDYMGVCRQGGSENAENNRLMAKASELHAVLRQD